MRCILCLSLSFDAICKRCRKTLLKPALYVRKLKSGLIVYSFYPYNEIEGLLLTKHSDLGARVYKDLADAIKPEILKLLKKEYSLVALEGDRLTPYSHTALLAKELNKIHKNVPMGVMIDKSGIRYSGKSLDFRIRNAREFQLTKQEKISKKVVLLDDVVTTGITFESAAKVMRESGFDVKFCIALSDAKNVS